MRRTLRNALLGGWLISAIAAGWWLRGDRARTDHQDVAVARPQGQRDPAQHVETRAPDEGAARREVIDINPRAPDYDPVRLGAVLDVSARQLFEREPRMPAWAERVEVQQRSQMEALRAVFPSIEVDEVECRTATCRTTIVVDPAELEDMLEYVQMFVPVGEVVGFDLLDAGSTGDRAHVNWFGSFSPQHRDVLALQAEHERRFPGTARERDAWIARRDQRREVQ